MKHNVGNVTTGALLVALSALGYATNPILGKFAYQAGATAITLGAIRFSFAAAGLWVMLAVRGEVRGVPVMKRLQLLTLGVLGFAMVSLLYFTALQGQIGASLATGIFYAYPAFVAIVGVLRGDGISRMGIAGLLLTIAGTWLLLGTDLGAFSWRGALLIVASAGIYAAYIFVGDRISRDVSPTAVSAHLTTGAAALYLVLAALTGQVSPGAGAYAAGVGLALLSTILALVTFFAGLPRVGPTRASIISTLEPVFTALLAVLLLGERLTLLQTGGIALVVLGAVAAQVKEGPRSVTKAA
jgi:drug/metabolite transporter (DMT)-like permease